MASSSEAGPMLAYPDRNDTYSPPYPKVCRGSAKGGRTRVEGWLKNSDAVVLQGKAVSMDSVICERGMDRGGRTFSM